MEEVTLAIDGKEVKIKEGATILEAAKSAGVLIPTFCYYDGLPPAGACRLCSVEIITRGGRKRIVTSCNYPVEEGLEVNTKSPEIVGIRKMIIELMLARCPNVKKIQDLAREYEVGKPRFALEEEKCILCGLCERVCEKIGMNVISSVGRGVYREMKTPYQMSLDANLDFCMSCGACMTVCPTEAMEDMFKETTRKIPIPIPSEFEVGLKSRKPIYIPFPQAVPAIPTIDRERCAHFVTDKCKICEEICDPKAVNFEQKEELIELEVGSIIVATGFDLFDVRGISEYGYGRYKNVLMSLEFERLLCASGPTGGHLVRPSDNRVPERIVFIQCVGSRSERGETPYCSSVCCAYATKEAILIKEHEPKCDVQILYMDLRVFGKGFQEFVNRAEKEWGVKYTKGRPSRIEEDTKTGDLLIRYEDMIEGEIKEIEADLVVLCPALIPKADNKRLAEILGVKLDEYGFFESEDVMFAPISTNVPGIFICGYGQGPKDIPESVAQASGAAAKAAEVIAIAARGSG